MAWSCHYATGCFVAFLGDISILKSGWSMKKVFCCPALELYHCLPPLFCCLPLWKTVRLHGKKLQNAPNTDFYVIKKLINKSQAQIITQSSSYVHCYSIWKYLYSFGKSVSPLCCTQIKKCISWYLSDTTMGCSFRKKGLFMLKCRNYGPLLWISNQ